MAALQPLSGHSWKPLLTKSRMEQNNEQSVRRFAEKYTAAWCSQNAASVATCYQENGSLSVNEDAPAVGRQAITEVAQGFMTAFPDMKVLMDDVELRDNGTVYRWTLSGTNTGPGGTSRTVRISGFEVWQLGADGLIANSNGHFDSADYHRQLGTRIE